MVIKDNTKPTHNNALAPLSIQINPGVLSLTNITIPIAHNPNINNAKTIPNPNRQFAWIQYGLSGISVHIFPIG